MGASTSFRGTGHHDIAYFAEWLGRDIKNWVADAQKTAVDRAVSQGGAKRYKLTVADLLAIANSVRRTRQLKDPPG